MERYEYKLVATPSRGTKNKSVAQGDDLFAHKLTDGINDLACNSCQYLRTKAMIEDTRSILRRKSQYQRDYMLYLRTPEQ